MYFQVDIPDPPAVQRSIEVIFIDALSHFAETRIQTLQTHYEDNPHEDSVDRHQFSLAHNGGALFP